MLGTEEACRWRPIPLFVAVLRVSRRARPRRGPSSKQAWPTVVHGTARATVSWIETLTGFRSTRGRRHRDRTRAARCPGKLDPQRVALTRDCLVALVAFTSMLPIIGSEILVVVLNADIEARVEHRCSARSEKARRLFGTGACRLFPSAQRQFFFGVALCRRAARSSRRKPAAV